MSGLPRTQVPEVDRIVIALDVLLVALFAHDAAKPVDKGPLKFISASDLPNISPIEGLLEDPIRKGLRLGMHLAGERLHYIGGTALMHRVLDRVCRLAPHVFTRRSCSLDHAWNNIGVDVGRDIWVS
jgi:hypothetical protein